MRTSSYLDPAASILDSLLPNGALLEEPLLDGRSFRPRVVDVTHPYLLLSFEEVIGEEKLNCQAALLLIEAIRGKICLRLGLVSSRNEANAYIAGRAPCRLVIHAEGNSNLD